MRCRALVLLLVLAGCAPTGGAEDPAGTDGPVHQEGAARTEQPFTSSPRPTCPADGAIVSATWTRAEGGRSLEVVPADALRDCAGPLVRWDDIPPGWSSVLTLAGSEADSPGMLQQYTCHLRFAPAKDTWNLEPWRPDVTQEQLWATGCNPVP